MQVAFERIPVEKDILAEILLRNAIHVRCLNTGELGDHEVVSACAVLSPEEKLRQRQLHFPEDRRDFASAHALLRQSLSLYSDINPEDWRFKVDVNGKPFILRTGNQRQKPFSFSLSHTRGLVACAIGTQLDVGIDVERLDRMVDIDSIAPLCLSSSELNALMRCPGHERQIRFIELWVLKEALVKAIGTGLSDLKGSSFTLREDGGIELVSRLIDQAEWHFELFRPTPRYRLGVAVKCSSAKVSVRWAKLDSEAG
jgi:4'-phosphopantetheinyl transferase